MSTTGKNDITLGSLSPNRFKPIPSSLIEECKQMSIKNGETMFIFDTSDRKIANLTIKDRNGVRDFLISEVLESQSDDYFYIGDESEFSFLPSRLSYYDTITNTTNQGLRKQRIFDFLYYVGLVHEDKYEVRSVFWDSGIKNNNPKLFIEVNENLTILARVLSSNDENDGLLSPMSNTYNFFFSKSKILDILSKVLPKEELRELKLKKLLNKNYEIS